ncbi:hypothetical protein DER44DRAFT_752297 [Fusarium oxysporum]|nr:hypothetical protein DER44DRAFT_752297 [Fusarium oxysporum]
MESSTPSSSESSAQHPGLFNPVSAKSNSTFHLFPNLPKEVRDIIWEQSLMCERYIAVELWGRDGPSGEFCRRISPPRHPPVNQHYKLVLINPPRPNAICGTSAESRASACRFYRVHLPCYSVKGSKLHAPGTFWFNPELDTLEIHGLEHFTTLQTTFGAMIAKRQDYVIYLLDSGVVSRLVAFMNLPLQQTSFAKLLADFE